MCIGGKAGEYGMPVVVDERNPRYLKSKNAKSVSQHVEYVRDRVRDMKLDRAIKRLRYRVFTGRLKRECRIGRELNRIDEELQHILMAGEKKLEPRQKETWSDILWELRRERKY